MKATNPTSQQQMVRSTGIIGGSQVVSILVGIARTKIISILLGPSGIGLLGLYQNTMNMIGGVSGLGLGFSGVKVIANATSQNDLETHKTIVTIKRWALIAGLLGVAIASIFAIYWSKLAFGDTDQVLWIAFASLTLLFGALTSGQLAILQGMRKIKEMAKANITGATCGLVASLPFYLWLGLKGIVPAFIITAFITMLAAFFFSKGGKTTVMPKVSWKESLIRGKDLITLGSTIVVSMLVSNATIYLITIFLSSKGGTIEVGYFQAAWTLSTVYLGTVLAAMSTDYFPRLTTLQSDAPAVNKLANEQTEVALLVISPMIVTLIGFMSVALTLFFSSKFLSAIPIIQWLLLGTMLKVLSWPLGFILLAKNKMGTYLFSEISGNLVFLLSIFFGYDLVGFEITGISYLLFYGSYLLIVLFASFYLTRFQYTKKTTIYILVFGITILLSLLISKWIPTPFRFIVNGLLTFGTGLYSLIEFKKMFPDFSVWKLKKASV